MEWLLTLPAFLKVGLSFALILVLNRFKINLGYCLLIASVFLGLFMRMGPVQIITSMVRNAVAWQTVSLDIIVISILILSRLMSEVGQLKRIVEQFSRLVRSERLTSAIMPALIGLLPMPGGALFSAPMVETACQGKSVSPEAKTALNYWFRHLWECSWPLYPGVVLAVSLLQVDAFRFMMFMSWTPFVIFGCGALFLWRLIPAGRVSNSARQGNLRWFMREVSPVLLVILSVPAVKVFELASGIKTPAMTSVFLGLALCLTLVIRQNRVKSNQFIRAVLDRSIIPMVVLVISIMIFEGILIDSRAVAGIQTDMNRYGIPPIMIILLMPFLSGFITGIAVGYVGASFPLIVPMLHAYTGMDFMVHAALAYTAGYLGMMLSPVHLCFLVTKDFFTASLPGAYRYLIRPVAAFSVCLAIFYVLTRWLV